MENTGTEVEKLHRLVRSAESITQLQFVRRRAMQLAVRTGDVRYLQIARMAGAKLRYGDTGIRRRQIVALNECCGCNRIKLCLFEILQDGIWQPLCAGCAHARTRRGTHRMQCAIS